MRKILVTGAAGFIPSTLITHLVKDPSTQVVGIDNLLTGRKENLKLCYGRNFRFVLGDVNDYKTISALMLSDQFDFVFHYAAVVGVTRTLENPLLVLRDIDGIRHILDLSKNTGVQRIYFSSSSEVYGEPVEFPQNEMTTPLNSKLPYAIVKNVSEAFVKSYSTQHDLTYTIFRFFNTYGDRQSSDFVVSKFIRSALRNEAIIVNGDGLQTRSFLHVEDNVKVTLRCLNEGLAANDVVNVGSNGEITIRELAELIIKLTNSKSEIVHSPALVEGDMRRRCPDNSKMKSILQGEPISLEEGLKLVIQNIARNAF